MTVHLTARRMGPGDVGESAALIATLLGGEGVAEHAGAYGGAGDTAAIRRALELLLERPELGFAWLVFDGTAPVGIAIASLSVSTNFGGLVAKVPDLVVRPDARGTGVGRFLVESLMDELRRIGAGRLDLGVHDGNDGAKRFYDRLGFVQNHEIGLSRLL